MELYSKVIREVESLPSGPQIGAFFDFDGTVIHGYSAKTYLREQVRRGDVSPRQLIELTKTMVEFGLGNMGFSAMMTIASQYLQGISEEEYLDFAEKLYVKHIAKLIYPESRALIEAHLKKGHTVALVSAATPYQLIPAARELGIDHVKCSKLEVVDGKFTGAVLKPTCYGMGKVLAAEQIADEFGVEISQSFFYSDSDEDIQLLEHVGNPRPLNPNSRLRSIAKGRGWPVQDFHSRGKTGILDLAKTAAAQASMLTSVLAGLPIYALTGSINKTRNFSTSLFADTAAALTGIELDVRGEENAWAHRPCVFVFNHQSQADVIVLPSLLRRDLAGVGKKEIGDVPILGKIMEWGGTVLIDRENSHSAREAMKPLVDVLLKEGRSVCIAPEGTRSTSTNLGRFKKGAFHLAMQAGVPVVPIVIHNAIDVAPRGQYAFRPATVNVTVLPGVDTSDWTIENMDQQVEMVRDMFLEELDQMQFQPARDSKLQAAEKASRKRREQLKVSAKATSTNATKARGATSTSKTKPSKSTSSRSSTSKSKPELKVVRKKTKSSKAAQSKSTPTAGKSRKSAKDSASLRVARRRKKNNTAKVSARTLNDQE